MSNNVKFIHNTFLDLKAPNYDTLYIYAKNVIIKDCELGLEIDLTKKINQFDKIVIDGITFVKESNNE